MIDIIDKKLCCGCNACVQKCPKQCIAMVEDTEGFLYPHIDSASCIDCGLCEKVCPMLNLQDSQTPLQVLAVKNKNEEERMMSSSGGVFIALAKQILARNGVVFGAVFDENWEVRHVFTETIEGVHKMMGSKYLQSRIEDSFKDAERFLKEGREVLFSGSPCQIAGLKQYLRKDYDNLLAVDFICHGVPSPGVWRRYLEEERINVARRATAGKNSVLKSSLNAVPEISGIEFRDKTLNGWKKYSFVIRGKSASKADQNTVLSSDIFPDNSYMRGFLADIYLRPSCYACQHKSGRSHSDITIADFWGINSLIPEFDDDKGVGLVLLNNDKGEQMFESLEEMETRASDLATICNYNPAYCRSARRHPKREEFYRLFATRYPFDSIIDTCLIPLHVRIKRNVLRYTKVAIRKTLPEGVVKTIKKIRR